MGKRRGRASAMFLPVELNAIKKLIFGVYSRTETVLKDGAGVSPWW